jgi:DNA-binding NarL/FixJ family response regulator
MTEPNPLRILIADDHPLFRDGIQMLLSTTEDLHVVGEATTGEEAIALAEQTQPDVILMDLRMPGLNGIEATRRIIDISPQSRVLVVTMFDDDASVFTAMRAGARGYMLKDAQKEDLLRAIRAVGKGEAIFSPTIATRMLDFFAAERPAVPRGAFPSLTDREREILHLIVRDASNTGIARSLSLSGKTVANYVSNILGKLQVSTRAEAAEQARKTGLV